MAEEQIIYVDDEGKVLPSGDPNDGPPKGAVRGEVIDEDGNHHLFTITGEQPED